jgi:P27 family predicted phage terminase small subunit
MTRAQNPASRRGNANEHSLAEKPRETEATNVLELAIPTAPASFGDLKRPYRLKAYALWTDIWTAGHGFYLEATDAYIIERYVSLQVRRAKLMAILEDEGYVTEGSQGQDVAHPAARLLLDIEGKLPALEDRLGLSPEARLRLGLAVAETKSKLDAFREEVS